ncbi:TetR/AcrR family transcriptional regulator [Neorhizobium sp. T25_27]|uniref:TetR/AcrR family transcriptional regulator n=1 Tax=Neorhizobium sp. T25_27 TaxID=2093831 RepID=UPI000CF8ACB2|nr:TetR/AcrR family transcriptional regulator [Neorhizobium sp. T25_27]
MTTASKRGRSRSVTATLAVQAAALALATEIGPERVTIERIATASGVAKTTIYRRWPNAAAVIMDAFLSDIQSSIAYRKGTTLQDMLCNALGDFARALVPSRKDLLRHLVGASQSDDELARAFWEKWIGPRRESGQKAMQEFGVSSEEASLALDLLYGAFYYRMLIPYAEIDDAWINAVVQRVFPATNAET